MRVRRKRGVYVCVHAKRDVRDSPSVCVWGREREREREKHVRLSSCVRMCVYLYASRLSRSRMRLSLAVFVWSHEVNCKGK